MHNYYLYYNPKGVKKDGRKDGEEKMEKKGYPKKEARGRKGGEGSLKRKGRWGEGKGGCGL